MQRNKKLDREDEDQGVSGLEILKSIWNIKDSKPQNQEHISNPVSSDIYSVPDQSNQVPHRKHF